MNWMVLHFVIDRKIDKCLTRPDDTKVYQIVHRALHERLAVPFQCNNTVDSLD